MAEHEDPALRATFDALYPTLGVEDHDAPFAATITPALSASGASHGVTLASLPRLSIALDADHAHGAPLPATRELDVVGLLGEGGMGRVLLGRQRSLDRDVAIKTVKPELLGTKQVDALVAEGVITGMLEHPNITPVHQLGLDAEGRPVLVMKRIVGVSWEALMADPAHPFWAKLDALPQDRLHAHLEILGQVANALAYAHSRDVIHRDVKPENVMIGEFGEVYLVDFGIATKLRGDAPPKGLVGTPAFMAPEMIDERLGLGAHTDVYLLGATLHFLLTGRSKHEGRTLPEVLCAAFQSTPYDYSESVPVELAALANQSTARERAVRPQSALAFRKALTSYATHRAARALSDVASSRLEEIERLAHTDAVEPAKLARLVSECRFGFLMALREWPACESAQLGLERCLEHVVRIEIARESLGAAEAALAELRTPSPALVEALEALRARLRARDGAQDKLREIIRDRDLSVAAKHRRSLAIFFLVVAVAISVVIHGYQLVTGHDSSASGGFVLGAGTLLAVLGALVGYLGRRLFSQNAINRSLTLVFMMTILFQLVHRIVAYGQGIDSRVILPGDMMIVASTTFAAGALVFRAWTYPALFTGVCALLCAPFPQLTELFYFVAMISVLATVGFTWRDDEGPGPV